MSAFLPFNVTPQSLWGSGLNVPTNVNAPLSTQQMFDSWAGTSDALAKAIGQPVDPTTTDFFTLDNLFGKNGQGKAIFEGIGTLGNLFLTHNALKGQEKARAKQFEYMDKNYEMNKKAFDYELEKEKRNQGIVSSR